MYRMHLLIVAIIFWSFSFAATGESVTQKDLVGAWKIADVKITNGNSAKAVTKDNCYFADLYRAKLGLVFTADGKVNYSNYGNANSVAYSLTGNVLSLFSDEADQTQKKPNRTTEDFVASFNNSVLTLTRIDPEFTETYTLTK
jgi:hypothetical protein